jgi:hypothetical protein
MRVTGSSFFLFIVLSFFSVVLLIAACTGSFSKSSLRQYYFPAEELLQGQVYEYRSVGEEKYEPEYWYFRSFETDTATYLTGQFYDLEFNVRQFFREEYVSNGSFMLDYILYQPDTSGELARIDADILAPNGLPFEEPDTTSVFLFKIQWEDPEVPGRTVTLIRNRRFIGFEDWTHDNKSIECAVFEVKEIIETEEEGFQEIRTYGLERYGKGYGLIYYEKKIDDDLFLQYALFDRYSMEKLEEKFEKTLEK